MSAVPAIRVEHVGKQYRVRGGTFTPHLTEQITRALRRPWRQAPPLESFWALQDVSFELQAGEAVGIIGRNGAGKSTLLKVLSRITRPTTGRIELHGRVGSLLEVGTGFHPELTGRENIYLNGAILGMRRGEIARKFDEIVAFAEVERFIDTPVKHYSSGMAVRLAFAVAAYLETEILVVDEVLAVGDTAFQKKCLGKMGDVTRQGRTVLLVSHDLTSIQVLCQRALRLAHGRVLGLGSVDDEVRAYLADVRHAVPGELAEPLRLSDSVTLERWGFSPNPVPTGGAAEFTVQLASTRPIRVDELAVLVHDTLNRRVGVIDFRRADGPYKLDGRRPLTFTATFPSIPLVEGEYRLGCSIRTGETHSILSDLVTLDVIARADAEFVPYSASIRGIVAFDFAFAAARPEAP